MGSFVGSHLTWILVSAAALLAGCERYDKPNRPLPDSFEAELLADGSPLRADELRGKPWVIALWVPG